MKKIIWVIAIIALFVNLMPGQVEASTKWVRLGGVKIGKIPVEIYWYTTDTMLVCKSDKIQIGDSQISSVYYWVNGGFVSEELTPNTLVSRDTVCTFLNTAKGGMFATRYWIKKYRFIQTWSTAEDVHRDLIYADQEITFSIGRVGLWCKAKILAGYTLPRYQNVVFTPFDYSPRLFSSRDITCSSNEKVTSRWKQLEGWTVLDL